MARKAAAPKPPQISLQFTEAVLIVRIGPAPQGGKRARASLPSRVYVIPINALATFRVRNTPELVGFFNTYQGQKVDAAVVDPVLSIADAG